MTLYAEIGLYVSVYVARFSFSAVFILEYPMYIQGAAEITPTFWKWIEIKRNKVHKKISYLYKAHMM